MDFYVDLPVACCVGFDLLFKIRGQDSNLQHDCGTPSGVLSERRRSCNFFNLHFGEAI
jgi:hypothetical protein